MYHSQTYSDDPAHVVPQKIALRLTQHPAQPEGGVNWLVHLVRVKYRPFKQIRFLFPDLCFRILFPDYVPTVSPDFCSWFLFRFVLLLFAVGLFAVGSYVNHVCLVGNRLYSMHPSEVGIF